MPRCGLAIEVGLLGYGKAGKLIHEPLIRSVEGLNLRTIARREASDETNPPPIYLFVYGLQRYRMLRKSEDEFSFGSGGEEEKKANPGKQFADLLREGPPHGIHVVAWSDTPASVERTLDRASLREFDNRVLFQMSANDSSNLIDSPVANKLGQNRALAYSEEQGTLEKFRPYALPDDAWLAHVRQHAPEAVDPEVPLYSFGLEGRGSPRPIERTRPSDSSSASARMMKAENAKYRPPISVQPMAQNHSRIVGIATAS